MANEDNFMITELRGAKGETFQEDMIVQHLKISGAHSDGITSI